MKREHAWRVFAMEYNDTLVSLKGDEKMAPSYVLTPLGAKVNRLFLVGVLTDVESMADDESFVRGHVSDPTGVFTLFSGQFQPEITKKLLLLDVPSFVAVTGKSRSYQPEEGGTMFASVRPEEIVEVTAPLRNQWILETILHTKIRIEAVKEASSMDTVTTDELIKLGFSRPVAEGVFLALEQYDRMMVEKYVQMLQDALDYMRVDEQADMTPDLSIEKSLKEGDSVSSNKRQVISPVTTEQDEEAERIVMEVIKNHEGDDGVSWDVITKTCGKQGLDDARTDEALNSLMDKGLIYEPVLGTIKTT